jgi:cytochrome c oxidase cbb3-type subunit III
MSPPADAATADQVRIDDAPDEARVMTHAYDGIREYDNPLPGWWRMIFIGTVVFAGFYWLYFHVVGWGMTPDARYKQSLAAYDDKKALRDQADLANVTEESMELKVRDGQVVAHGKDVFAQRCASCHGPEGAGLIGPNLTDRYQIHGSSRLDIYRTVRGGAPGTAMLAWGDQLPQADVVAAAAFVITLRGTNVAGKPPQGASVGAFSP